MMQESPGMGVPGLFSTPAGENGWTMITLPAMITAFPRSDPVEQMA